RLVIDPLPLPPMKTPVRGRHALVVVRGHNYRADLAALRAYIDDVQPVLIGVDGGADALLEAGLRPHVVVGDMDSVSDAALRAEEHTSELQSRENLVCRLLLEKKKNETYR